MSSIEQDFVNISNIQTNFPHSSQRWRYYIENSGTLEREYIKYGNRTGFTETDYSKRIEAPSGGVAEYRTAEIFNHVTGNSSLVNTTFQLNQSLSSGEKFVVGYGNPDLQNNMAGADGWFVEFEPNLSTNECLFSVYNNGNIITNGGNKKLVELVKPYTYWQRLSLIIQNLGAVGSELHEKFAEADGNVRETQVGRVSATANPLSPSSSNNQIRYTVKGQGNGLEMEIGHTEFKREQGSSQSSVRPKALSLEDISINTTGTYVPVVAAREQPDKETITGTLNSLEIVDFDSEATVKVVVKAFAKDKVTFSTTNGWNVPPEFTEQETTIELRQDVDSFADSSGSLVQDSNGLGGNLVASSVDVISSSGGGPGQGNASSFIQNKSTLPQVASTILDSDVLVLLVKATSTGNLTVNFSFTENW